jgi:spore coat polysaccharide biosynthesis protein SpsF
MRAGGAETNPTARPLAVVQARSSSSRLPGKVLMPLAGQPMILRQLERIARASTLDGIVVATSLDPHDDELASIVTEAGFPVVRGSLTDVLGRFIDVLDAFGPRSVVRLTGDCPLTCPEVVDQVVADFLTGGADYVSNTLIPTFPDGLDVEVVSAAALREIAAVSTDPVEREHVTLGLYRRDDNFAVRNVVDSTGRDHSNLRWTVDSSEDFQFVSWVFDTLYVQSPNFDYAQVLDLVSREPLRSRTSQHARRNAALDGLDTGAMRHTRPEAGHD